jgi:2-C-methyl-D-erythritol 4-phosphate cytidylyltransferase/2-C-methyl-D-erythritol 2,4-cyclodiphosphate synthase
MASVCAIIVAAGRGTRAATDGPKQYAMLGDRTVLARTLSVFEKCNAVDAIQVVIHADDHEAYNACISGFEKLLPPVDGGATRQASVRAGLQAAANYDRVLIHDAARPFLDQAILGRIIGALETNMGAVPALPVVDTLRRRSKKGLQTIDRDGLFAAQTPQAFDRAAIAAAHEKAAVEGRDDFTDDAALAEWAGLDVTLVDGARANHKLTTSEDMREAMEEQNTVLPDIRVGHGYDTHTLGVGDHVMLCGVRIPHNRALQGHSDADVGIHALTDALLATIGAGDIGDHFPPSDPQWRGAASDQFLAHAAQQVRAKGGQINHADVTLVCEAPKIGPHREAMRQRMAEILQIAVGRVSVKATTNEKVGFIGRGEGIVALTTATVGFER